MKAVVNYASGGTRWSMKKGREELPNLPAIENVTIEKLEKLNDETGNYGFILSFLKDGTLEVTVYDDYVE